MKLVDGSKWKTGGANDVYDSVSNSELYKGIDGHGVLSIGNLLEQLQ